MIGEDHNDLEEAFGNTGDDLKDDAASEEVSSNDEFGGSEDEVWDDADEEDEAPEVPFSDDDESF